MTAQQRVKLFEKLMTTCELIGVVLVSVMAVVDQLYLNELPCPLCLLQRVGFVAIAFGFLMNLRYGFRPSHYSMILISALFTSFVALRQVALHVLPGTGAYGSPFLGLHLYTWCFIISMIIVVASALLLGVDNQYKASTKPRRRWPFVTNFAFTLVSLIIVVNIVFVILQCGLKTCPDNPASYELINSIKHNLAVPK